jgi:hypothetical protein
MSPVLRSRHAEYVEPGAEIPDGADPAIVDRLRSEGKVEDAPTKSKPKSSSSSSGKEE